MAGPDYDLINDIIQNAKKAVKAFEEETSKNIADAVNSVLNSSQSRPSSAYKQNSAFADDIKKKQQQNAANSGYKPKQNPQAKDYERTNMGIKTAYGYSKWQPPQLYKDTGSEKAGGVVKSIFGYGLAAVGGAILIGGGAAILAGGTILASLGALVGGGILIAAGVPIGVSGSKQVSRVNRFKEYVKELAGKTVIQLKNLAKNTGRTVQFLRDDLQDMSDRRYFTQGHFDEDKEQFITSDETYQNYLYLLEEKKKADEVAKQADQLLRESGLSETGIEIVRQGQEYLGKIQRMNTELPGEEITEKLQGLESVIARILVEIKNQPGKATDLRRMMNYYLPTTWNLLQTYKQIEDEPVKTQQMLTTQKEIEETIDMVQDAFENLLDRLFRDKSWDVSADISVLNSMLKQDSLKDDNINAYSTSMKEEE